MGVRLLSLLTKVSDILVDMRLKSPDTFSLESSCYKIAPSATSSSHQFNVVREFPGDCCGCENQHWRRGEMGKGVPTNVMSIVGFVQFKFDHVILINKRHIDKYT